MEYFKNDSVNVVLRSGRKTVEINTIIFSGKRKIDWDGVETYLRKYIGSSYAIDENDEVVYIGKDFPGEYAHSKYSAKALGTIGKAKANLSQAIPELIKTATNIAFRDNINEKHSKNAKYGWYRCTVHFSIPITNDKGIPIGRNYYQGRMIIRWDEDGRKYLYDIIDKKKKRSTSLEQKLCDTKPHFFCT